MVDVAGFKNVEALPSSYEITVADIEGALRAQNSVLATGAAAFVQPAPVENRATDRLTPDHRTPRQVDVETLLAAAPATSHSVAAAAPVAFPLTEAADDGRGWMATWLGVLLMALGLVSVLGSSRTLREVALLRD